SFMEYQTTHKLSPEYISGYVDGEGCFSLSFRKDVRHERKNAPVYYSWKAQFMITARKDEIDLFERIKYSFGCGKIYNQKKNGINSEIHYCVSNLEDLNDIISPFLKKHNLQAKKKYDFELWAEAINIMHKNRKKRVNAQKGIKGFSKNNWEDADFKRLLKIHSDMQKYKSERPNGLKHINVAHHQFHSDPDKDK
ncbi:MAG: LAGLIDADG family homing endonuclease, partial [Candidatus Staskawiczbacteria bacterium]|nr:LAGLIDADG family homing endonuclease [Candidatus Staskawiczbacteria bacterium]